VTPTLSIFATLYVDMLITGATSDQLGASGGALARSLAAAAAAATGVPSATVSSLAWSNVLRAPVLSYNTTCANVSGVVTCFNITSNVSSARRLAGGGPAAPKRAAPPRRVGGARALQAPSSVAAAVCNASAGVTAESAVQVNAALQFTDADLSDLSIIASLALGDTTFISQAALRVLILRALALRIRAQLPAAPAAQAVLATLTNCSGVATAMNTTVTQTPAQGNPVVAGGTASTAVPQAVVLGLVLGLGLGGCLLVAVAVVAWRQCRAPTADDGFFAAATAAPPPAAGPFCVAILVFYDAGAADTPDAPARLARFAERLPPFARAAAARAADDSAHRPVVWHAFVVEAAPGGTRHGGAARGAALNAAAAAALRRETLVTCGVDARARDAGGFQALLIHDIDLAPDDADAGMYFAAVPPSRDLAEPVHLGSLWPRPRAAPADRARVAGALLTPVAAFVAANGFPNTPPEAGGGGGAGGDEDAALQARLAATGALPRDPWAATSAVSQPPAPPIGASDAMAAPGLRESDSRLVRAVPLADGVSQLSFELF
jgi:hypothetical protein